MVDFFAVKVFVNLSAVQEIIYKNTALIIRNSLKLA